MSTNLPLLDSAATPIGEEFARLMDEWFKLGVSDITVQSGDYVWAYLNRLHTIASTSRLDPSAVDAIVRSIYNDEGWMGELGRGKPIDVDSDIRPYLDSQKPNFNPDYSIRVRANISRTTVGVVENGVSITLRTIPGGPLPLAAMKLPKDIEENLFPTSGLIIVVGVTGSGKSTLLSSAIGEMLMRPERPVKILTVEDPVEFKFAGMPAKPVDGSAPKSGAPAKPRMPEVSQMQLKKHLASFDLAAPNVLRRKADVLFMGEMRDKQTVETGLLLAATGHATYATMHCDTPAEAIGRAVSEFPIEGQPAIANKMLADLRLIIAQKIERTVEGKGMAFRSWCLFDQALKEKLSEEPFAKWGRMIRRHMEELGNTFAQQALPHYKAGLISEQAFANIAGFNVSEARAFLERNSAEESLA